MVVLFALANQVEGGYYDLVSRAEHSHVYRPDVDGLRALAVGAVIVFHAFPKKLPGGFLGVDVFFVISGFLITGMMLDGIRAGRFSLLEFYLRRARRILPALLTMLVGVSLLAVLVLMPDEMERFASNLTAGALFVPNLVLAHEQGYFDAAAVDNPLLHLWSLGVEEQFYLLWPVALMLFVPRTRNRTTVLVIAVIILLSLALNIVMARTAPTASFYLPFTRFWQLLAGALLAALATAQASGHHSAALNLLQRAPWLKHFMSFAGLALIGGAILAGKTALSQPVLALPVTLGAALFIAAGPDALPNRTLFSWRPVVYVGLISYPLYLWHWPPLSFLHIMDLSEGTTGRLLRIGAVVFATVAAVSHLPPGRSSDSPTQGSAQAWRAAARRIGRCRRRGRRGGGHGWTAATHLDRSRPFLSQSCDPSRGSLLAALRTARNALQERLLRAQ